MNLESNTPKREAQVPERIHKLEKIIVGLGEAVEHLEERLKDVIVSEQLSPEKEILKERSELVPLADELYRLTALVESRVNRIANIICRLEL